MDRRRCWVVVFSALCSLLLANGCEGKRTGAAPRRGTSEQLKQAPKAAKAPTKASPASAKAPSEPAPAKAPTKTPPSPSKTPPAKLVSGEAVGKLYRGRLPSKRTLGFHPAGLLVSGQKRLVKVYFPAKVAAKPALIIACHGTGGNAEDGVWATAANEAADTSGAVVVSLQARRLGHGDWDNHKAGQVYFETYPKTTLANNNDLQLVAAVIHAARKAYKIDPRRVYIAGFSNGAFFAQFAAMALADRIAGFASAAGGLVRCGGTGSCGFRGTAKTCAALAKQAGWCLCSGQDKPIALVAGARRPAAYIAHSVRDDTVSSYYSCELATRLKKLGHPTKLVLRTKGDHSAPPHFMAHALKFLDRYPLKATP